MSIPKGFQGRAGSFKMVLGVFHGISETLQGFSRGFRGVLGGFMSVSGVFEEFQECHRVFQNMRQNVDRSKR